MRDNPLGAPSSHQDIYLTRHIIFYRSSTLTVGHEFGHQIGMTRMLTLERGWIVKMARSIIHTCRPTEIKWQWLISDLLEVQRTNSNGSTKRWTDFKILMRDENGKIESSQKHASLHWSNSRHTMTVGRINLFVVVWVCVQAIAAESKENQLRLVSH